MVVAHLAAVAGRAVNAHAPAGGRPGRQLLLAVAVTAISLVTPPWPARTQRRRASGPRGLLVLARGRSARCGAVGRWRVPSCSPGRGLRPPRRRRGRAPERSRLSSASTCALSGLLARVLLRAARGFAS